MSCYHYGLLRAFGVADRRRRVVYYSQPEESLATNAEHSSPNNINSTDSEQNSGRSIITATSSSSSTDINGYSDNRTDVVTSALQDRRVSLTASSKVEETTASSDNNSDSNIRSYNNSDSSICSYNNSDSSIRSYNNSDSNIRSYNNSDNIQCDNIQSDNSRGTVQQPEVVNMDENARVEEKLLQFKNDCKTDTQEDTRGTYTSDLALDKQRRRNLIFDEERFEETFLKCLICREVYNEVDKLPKMLHCHHTFCMDCLYQMYRVEGEFRQSLTGVFRSLPMTVKIQCPTCREGVIISESELRRLPNDHTIMELLYFVTHTGKNDVQYCTKHQMQPLNFFCEPCIMPVCCDCTVIDHKESKGHIVVNVDEAMKKYTPIVEETLRDIACEKADLAEKKEALESAQDDLDQIQKNLNSQIHSVFDKIRECLSEREKELYDVSESEIERKRDILHGHMKVLMDREAQLSSQSNELQKAKDDRDISLIFTGHKSAREVLSTQINIPTNSTKGFSVTFQFSSRTDSTIKQQLTNLGDIIFQS